MTRKTSRPSRPKGNRSLKPRIIIICEGEETEPNYFEDFISTERIRSAEVRIISGQCSPIAIVSRAIKEQSMLSGVHPEDSVWAVFDRDTHADFNRAMALASKNNINTIVSNPCFELWILLHYVSQFANISSKQALEKAQKSIVTYKKNRTSLYSRTLRTRTNIAINRAEQLDVVASNNGNIFDNPTTKVYKLVRFLFSHKGN